VCVGGVCVCVCVCGWPTAVNSGSPAQSPAESSVHFPISLLTWKRWRCWERPLCFSGVSLCVDGEVDSSMSFIPQPETVCVCVCVCLCVCFEIVHAFAESSFHLLFTWCQGLFDFKINNIWLFYHHTGVLDTPSGSWCCDLLRNMS